MRWWAEKKTDPSASDQWKWKTLKTQRDRVVIDVRQLEHTVGCRGWAVRCRPSNLLMRVWVTGRALKETPAGAQPHGRDWTEAEIERGVVRAVENALISNTTDVIREVVLTSYDLYSANGRL